MLKAGDKIQIRSVTLDKNNNIVTKHGKQIATICFVDNTTIVCYVANNPVLIPFDKTNKLSVCGKYEMTYSSWWKWHKDN